MKLQHNWTRIHIIGSSIIARFYTKLLLFELWTNNNAFPGKFHWWVTSVNNNFLRIMYLFTLTNLFFAIFSITFIQPNQWFDLKSMSTCPIVRPNHYYLENICLTFKGCHWVIVDASDIRPCRAKADLIVKFLESIGVTDIYKWKRNSREKLLDRGGGSEIGSLFK